MRPKFLAYGFRFGDLARVRRVFSGPARLPKPLTRNLNLATPTAYDPNGPGLPESFRAVSEVRTGLGRVPARAGSNDRAALPSGLASAWKDDRHRSEAPLSRAAVSVSQSAHVTVGRIPLRSGARRVAASARAVQPVSDWSAIHLGRYRRQVFSRR